MGLLNMLGGGGKGPGGAPDDLISAVGGMIGDQQGGLGGFVQQLTGKGLGEIVQSWVSTGPNLPVSGDQLKQALGGDLLKQLAARTGMAPEQVTAQLVELLPRIIDTLTPGGKVPEGGIGAQGLGLLKGLLK
ncbi:MAG: YidB family protein [Bacteroidota bacterium]